MSEDKEKDKTEGCDSCATCPGCGEPENDAPEKPATDSEIEQEEDK